MKRRDRSEEQVVLPHTLEPTLPTKSMTVRFKVRQPTIGEMIEIESTEGWERVQITGTQGKTGSLPSEWWVAFDDGSTAQVLIDNIWWRRVPQ